jgi:hypothetical protein
MSYQIGRRLRVVREIPEHALMMPGMPSLPAIPVGAIVHEYRGCTWGALSADEIAVRGTATGTEGFRGVPRDCVEDAPADEDPLMVGIRERAKASALRMLAELTEEEA